MKLALLLAGALGLLNQTLAAGPDEVDGLYYPKVLAGEGPVPWNEIWSDYAAGDFNIVVK